MINWLRPRRRPTPVEKLPPGRTYYTLTVELPITHVDMEYSTIDLTNEDAEAMWPIAKGVILDTVEAYLARTSIRVEWTPGDGARVVEVWQR